MFHLMALFLSKIIVCYLQLADVAKENTAEQTRFGTDQADSKATQKNCFKRNLFKLVLDSVILKRP